MSKFHIRLSSLYQSNFIQCLSAANRHQHIFLFFKTQTRANKGKTKSRSSTRSKANILRSVHFFLP